MNQLPAAIKEEALRLYRDTDLSINDIAHDLKIDPETVARWVATEPASENRQRRLGRHRTKLRARRMQVLQMAACGHPYTYIAKFLGVTTTRQVRKLLDRALAELAEELRDTHAWERAQALHLQHHRELLAVWLPKAIEGDAKSTELALDILDKIGRVSRFHMPPAPVDPGPVQDPAGGRTPLTPDVIADVLAGLATVAARINPAHAAVIDSTAVEIPQLPSPPPQPPGHLNGHRDLSSEHPS